MDLALLVGVYVLFPALVIWLCSRFPVLDKIGVVIVCYAVGMIVGSVLPGSPAVAEVQDLTTSAAVALALPLLLFSMNVREWSRLAGKATLSMLLAIVSIGLVAGVGFLLIRDRVPEAWQLGGMAVGLYTGGTPNLAAIRTALGVDADVYITMHTYDAVIGLLYILFAASIAQPLFSRFLPKFAHSSALRSGRSETAASLIDLTPEPHNGEPSSGTSIASDGPEIESISSYEGILRRETLLPLLGAFGVSALIVGVSVGLAELFPAGHGDAVTILAITALAIAASFITRLRHIRKTFQGGMYFVYIFCIAVGSMANFNELVARINWPILGFVVFCVFGSLFLHAFLARLFNIDADTMIITSVSAICSPPFVPVVANALRNPRVILSGLYTGIIGYAVGNFLGISMSYLLRALF